MKRLQKKVFVAVRVISVKNTTQVEPEISNEDLKTPLKELIEKKSQEHVITNSNSYF